VPTSSLRMTIKLGVDNVPESQLRELAQWAATESVVTKTLRDGPPVAVDISLV